jgi:hypothetical protein
VLDLGPALGANVAFFGGRPCSLYIADLPHSLFDAGMAPPPRRRGAFAQMLERDLPTDQKFDIILAWDLLNYLEIEEIGDLSRCLAGMSHADASLFALIATHKTMPARPSVFRIADPERLSYRLDSGAQRAAPMWKEPDLRRAMADFEIETTYLLRNGMQEYLFSRHPGPTAG